MDYVLGLSIFLVVLGGSATALVAIVYRYRHRRDRREDLEPELPLEGGRAHSKAA
jgi:hypothetical protein